MSPITFASKYNSLISYELFDYFFIFENFCIFNFDIKVMHLFHVDVIETIKFNNNYIDNFIK